jgi:Cysteine-rich CPXCG
MKHEANYNCDSCGDVMPIDLSTYDYVEDCPVCCRPNVIHVEVDTRAIVPRNRDNMKANAGS